MGRVGERSKYQRVNAHREAAQFNGMVSGRPATDCVKATARTGPPDTTFFISESVPVSESSDRSACEWVGGEGQVQLDRLGLAKE